MSRTFLLAKQLGSSYGPVWSAMPGIRYVGGPSRTRQKDKAKCVFCGHVGHVTNSPIPPEIRPRLSLLRLLWPILLHDRHAPRFQAESAAIRQRMVRKQLPARAVRVDYPLRPRREIEVIVDCLAGAACAVFYPDSRGQFLVRSDHLRLLQDTFQHFLLQLVAQHGAFVGHHALAEMVLRNSRILPE